MTWQTIDSAPRDGTDVLLWRLHKIRKEPIPPIVAACFPAEFGSDGWFTYDEVDVQVEGIPTHWMLIEPPASPPMRIPAHADSHDLAEGAIAKVTK